MKSNRIRNLVFALLVFICSAAGTSIADPVEIGLKALDRGHYATALRAWLPEARRGSPRAQNNVGYVYERGY